MVKAVCRDKGASLNPANCHDGSPAAFASNALGESNLPGGFRKNDPAEPPAGVEVALVAEDVEDAFRRALEAGAKAVAEPKTKPWGQTVAYVRDPDGVLVEIGDEVAPG